MCVGCVCGNCKNLNPMHQLYVIMFIIYSKNGTVFKCFAIG